MLKEIPLPLLVLNLMLKDTILSQVALELMQKVV
jgi:hypothetical protein